MIDRIRDELNARVEDDKPGVNVEVVNDGEDTFYLFQEGENESRCIVAHSRILTEVEP